MNPRTAINGTQKNIIEGFLKFPLDDIEDLKKPEDAIKALSAITNPVEDITEFKDTDAYSAIVTIRAILAHPCPQNRKVGDPTAASGRSDGLLEGRVYWWSNGFGSTVQSEPQGILGLTAKNDHTASPVTKEAVVAYIQQLINAAIERQQKKIATTPPLQFFQNISEDQQAINKGEQLFKSFKHQGYVLNNLDQTEKNNLMFSLGSGFISIDTLGHCPNFWIKAYCSDNVRIALKEGLVSQKFLQSLTFDYIETVCSKNGLEALREKIITPNQISKLTVVCVKGLLTDNGLKALRDKTITMDQIFEQSLYDIETMLKNINKRPTI